MNLIQVDHSNRERIIYEMTRWQNSASKRAVEAQNQNLSGDAVLFKNLARNSNFIATVVSWPSPGSSALFCTDGDTSKRIQAICTYCLKHSFNGQNLLCIENFVTNPEISSNAKVEKYLLTELLKRATEENVTLMVSEPSDSETKFYKQYGFQTTKDYGVKALVCTRVN